MSKQKLTKARSKIKRKKGVGRSAITIAPNGLPSVQCHLVVTRQSGDTERYLLAEVRSMLHAIEYRRKLAAVVIPKRLTSKDLREAA